MSFPGSSLRGRCINSGVTTEEGACVFPDKNVFIGSILDNQIHGKGRIEFVTGGRFEAEFEMGTIKSGHYYFKDELAHSEEYLNADNRMLWGERFGQFELSSTSS